MSVCSEVRFARPAALAAGLLCAAALVACGDKKAAAPAGAGAPPPPEVAVVTVQPGVVPLATELPGRLEASRVAQVRARATGILNRRVFTEGSNVRAGQVLYEVDPAPYQAAQQSAQAQLAQAEAQLANASEVAARYRPLVAANAVSQQEFDAAVASEKAAKAQVEAGRAAVRTASINLDYATVTAPISGRIGRSLVTEGALVSAAEGTQLALIQQINPLYINITQPAAQVLQLRQELQRGQLARAGAADAARVQVLLENGQPYRLPARLLFTDLSVDPATGQVSLRAEVPNPDGLLLPGLYVRVRLEQAQVDGAILLPQQAVTRGSHGDTVMVVAPDGAVAPRVVKIEGAQGQNWIVTGGLKAGEQVMVEGAMKLMMAPEVFLLPQQAVTRGNPGDTVMLAAPDGKAAPYPVKIKDAQGPNWIVTEGLKTGDRVMVDGAPKVMMGMKVVKPVPWQPGQGANAVPGATRPAAAPASAASH